MATVVQSPLVARETDRDKKDTRSGHQVGERVYGCTLKMFPFALSGGLWSQRPLN